ncbi:hypothetical protein BCR36DRAFT_410952 [Piromyces finnis]|uniref:Fibronectin type-III domain-containing protein n=1 Tax=Piromyces finnis TaxID=1754191 RepID=A0A1Y1VDU8_9FUNG|nr:hypothetical protein BCR36DRAFT_410952 [Piromyces finnis]|eukprot:ORX53795.1 hypothetical protein BCR36DRAFT_410952 [Piromyces finnis]
MIKSSFLHYIYILCLVVLSVYSLDLNINTKELSYKVQMNMDIIVKKNNIIVEWDKPSDDPHPNNFTLELLTNSTIDKSTGKIFCGGTYLIADNITDYQYKWKVIKLQKYDMYSFLVTANGYRKFGLSKTVYYAPNLYKFIKNKKGNSTLVIQYDDEDYIDDDDDDGDDDVAYNEVFNITTNSAIANQTTLAPLPTETPTVNNTLPTNPIINGPVDNKTNPDNQILPNEAIDKQISSDDKTNSLNVSHLIGLISGVLILAIALASLIFVNQRNKRRDKGVDAIILEKGKSNTSYSEGYTQDFNDYRSDTADSEVVREKLKREALAIERKKVLESINEKKLASRSSNYPTTKASSEAITNPTTDFSWQGMEVMSFSPIKVVGDPQKPIQHKPYDGKVNFDLQDIDQHNEYEVDITQNLVAPPDSNPLENTNINNDNNYNALLDNQVAYSQGLDANAIYSEALEDNAIPIPLIDENDNHPNSSTIIDIKE